MKTKQQVLDFLREESDFGNQIISASLGNGGSGLNISSYDITDDLEDMDFDGKVEPCEDLKSWREFDADYYTAYQFSDDSGFKIQVLTF